MLEFKGRCGNAKVMIDNIDQATISQIYEFLNHEAFTNPIAIMPDCHKGNGAVIGFTMEMTDKVIPNVVGVDISCGMFSFNVGKNMLAELSRQKINELIRKHIPFGMNVHTHNRDNINNNFFKVVSSSQRDFTMKFNKRFNTRHNPVIFDMPYIEQKCNDIGMNIDRMLKSVGTLGGGKI